MALLEIGHIREMNHVNASNEGFSGGDIKTMPSQISALCIKLKDSALVELNIQPCIIENDSE
jgi:hypothetical protein